MKVKSLSRVWPFETPWLQPTRLLCPWDFPGKSTGVGCHCLLHHISLNIFKSISLHFCWLEQAPKQGPYIILVVVLFNALFISEQSLWNTTCPYLFPMLLICWRNQVRNQTCDYDPHPGFVGFSNSSYNLVLKSTVFPTIGTHGACTYSH